MTSGSGMRLSLRLMVRGFLRAAFMIALLTVPAVDAAAGVVLKLGDILIAEPGTASVSVVDAVTGDKTVISQGGLLSPAHKPVGVALLADGDLVAVHRVTGLIRINPVTGAQTVLSQGGLFRDPWAVAVNRNTGDIYVADSGFDVDRPEINEPGKIIRVNPQTGAQTLIAVGSPCTVFPSGNGACQNTTAAGSYLTHPYGIAIDYTGVPGTLVVGDMSSFNGKGAIIRIQPVANGTQTLLWGPASAVPAPHVPQASPLGCPMGVAVEPNGNILTTVFTYPVPSTPVFPAPSGTFYGCAPPGLFRVDLANHVQSVVTTNAPEWQSSHAYAVGDVVRDETSATGRVHRVVTAGVSRTSSPPAWNTALGGTTVDGSVVWQNIGPGGSWLIPFGVDTEPASSQPSGYNIIVGDEGHSMLFRLTANGTVVSGGPLATELNNITSLDVINFTPVGGFKTEPIRSNGQPTGAVAAGTTQVTLSLTTDVNATCRYSQTEGVAYSSMTGVFTTTGSTTHSRTISGLINGNSYVFYVRCADTAGRQNTDDFSIAFWVSQPPSIHPIAAYGFDEGVGSVASDASGRGHDGAISGASWSAAGKYGTALSFDGIDDWVTVASTPILNPAGAMTLEAWVFPTSASGVRDVVVKEGTNAEVYNLYARNWQGLPETNAFVGGTGRSAEGTTLPANTWTHLAGTYNGSVLRLFVNGVEVASTPVSGPIASSNGVLRIGGNSFWNEFFLGRIDEVRIYNRALSQNEILADMKTPVNGGAADTTAPVRFNGQPVGLLPAATTQTTLGLTTGENATCRYSQQPGVAYGSMTLTFATTGSTSHSTTVTGLTAGTSYNFYVRCRDAAGNANTNDFVIAFSVANPSQPASSFAGVENPLSENGMWDSPGSWADLLKSDGAYAAGLNALARFVAPALSADQYSEILYNQDPGSSSWVGVTTRIQGPSNGSGYLAIAYAGEVRLYRVDDAGGLNFTLLASATANVGAAPRRLRLESQGNNHRVFFNGTQLINHTASGVIYSAGQPGIAASVFGGPNVKVLSFEGGIIGTPPADTTAPIRSNGQPAGTLGWGPTQATLSLATDENATCRYSQQAGVAYGSMTNAFTTTGGTTHSRTVTGLTIGSTYTFYVRCIDVVGNANTNDYVITFSVSNSGIPAGAQANYAFGNLAGGTVPNAAQGAGALPPLTVRGSDLRVSGNEIIWNEQINGFTHVFPFDSSRGTFAETVASFPNVYGSGGTVAVRLRLAATIASLGQSSSMGIVTWRPDPDINIHRVTPRGIEIHREGPSDPLQFLVREGNNSIGYNSEFNDEVRSGPISNPTAETTIIVVWDAQTLRIYVDGVLAGTTNRVTIDHPTPNYRVMVAVQPGLMHGGDRQFYEGAIRNLVVYNRVLTAAEIANLNGVLGSGLGVPPGDTTPPLRSNGQPSGTLPFGTGQATLSLTTQENATCRYSQQPGVAYGSMTNAFTNTGSTTHSSVVTGLTNGGAYTFYVRCADAASNTNPDDYVISFSVAATLSATSNFSGAESPLSEGGVWDSPGSWADLHKNNGAYVSGLNALARRVSPTIGAAQYSEITFDQDPGSSSWVGVTTRIQSGANGSGYLAIAYAGEIRLYRADDSGGLGFTLLAAAPASIGTAPRRLRLESSGDNHKVYFNGVLLINHTANGTTYSSGQPGIAASVFGGPQVKILSFEGGSLQ